MRETRLCRSPPKEIGASSRTNAIFSPHSPGNLATRTEPMRNVMIEADRILRVPNALEPAHV
jgi:hypothetical protein